MMIVAVLVVMAVLSLMGGFAGTIWGWKHEVETRMVGLETAASARIIVCETALALVAKDKYHAYLAKVEALRRAQKGIDNGR